MPPPGKPMLPRDRPVPPPPPLPPPKPPGSPLKVTEASLAQGDLVIIRSTSSAFHSLGGLVSQNSLEVANTQAESAGRPTAIRTMHRLLNLPLLHPAFPTPST